VVPLPVPSSMHALPAAQREDSHSLLFEQPPAPASVQKRPHAAAKPIRRHDP
jgi:hypothetical protein